MKHQFIPVTEFKAKCLALLDQIDRDGTTVTVTRRGTPLAMVGPVKKKPFKSSMGILEGKVKIKEDLLRDFSEDWEVVRDPERVLNPEKP
jgi:prevent-host-death family protein